MSKSFTNDFRIFTHRQEQSGASVAQIVKTNLLCQFGAFKDWPEVAAIEIAHQKGLAQLTRENEIVVLII